MVISRCRVDDFGDVVLLRLDGTEAAAGGLLEAIYAKGAGDGMNGSAFSGVKSSAISGRFSRDHVGSVSRSTW